MGGLWQAGNPEKLGILNLQRRSKTLSQKFLKNPEKERNISGQSFEGQGT